MSDNQNTTPAEPRTVSKIVAKTLGNPKAGAIAAHCLGIIMGDASDTKLKPQTNGDVFEAVTGSFEAVCNSDGSVFRSGVLYLPGGIHEGLVAAVKGANKDGASGSVKFAIELWSMPSTNAAGYSYEARTISETQRVDPLAELRGAVMRRRNLALTNGNGDGRIIDVPADPEPAQISSPEPEVVAADGDGGSKKKAR